MKPKDFGLVLFVELGIVATTVAWSVGSIMVSSVGWIVLVPVAVVVVLFVSMIYASGLWSLPTIRKPRPTPYQAKWWPGDMFIRDRWTDFWESVEEL